MSRLILLCGRYEGIDERVRELFVDEEISIGDYVLTGGELAAMVVIDAITRLLPGVLGSDRSAMEDSFFNSLLEYPQYTRPFDFRGSLVPEVLLSGNHSAISQWRRKEALKADMDPATGPPGPGRSQSGRSKTLGGDREGALRIARGWVKQNPNGQSRDEWNGGL